LLANEEKADSKSFGSSPAITADRLELTGANSIKVVTAGTTTVDTGSAILINDDGTITISATAVGNSKAISWVAMG